MVIVGLKNMLYFYKHIEVINTYTSGAELMDGLEQDVPDILLLDIKLPDKTGNELARIISKKYPRLKIIAITSMESSFHIKDMLQNGCQGYLLKTSSQQTLLDAIEKVYQGEEYLEPSLRDNLLKSMFNSQKKTVYKPNLTRRELEILQLIMEEYSNQEIADKLFVSHRTIQNHRFTLHQKLNAKNTVGLIKAAIQLGLI